MFDLLFYTIVVVVVLWLRSESQPHSDGVEVALPVVTLPVITDPWIGDITPVLSTVPTPVVSAPQLLLAPAVDVVEVVELIGFVESLIAIADPAVTPKFNHLSIVQLRSLGSFHQIKGAARWTKKQAIEVLSAA